MRIRIWLNGVPNKECESVVEGESSAVYTLIKLMGVMSKANASIVFPNYCETYSYPLEGIIENPPARIIKIAHVVPNKFEVSLFD